MNTRRGIAESIRGLDKDVAEAIELGLFSNQELSEELRGKASDYPKVSTEFFTLLRAASALEDL